MELKGLKINFLGDSITYGSTLTDKEDVYWSLLKRECGLAEARGYGIRGTRIAIQHYYEEPRDEQDFISRVDQMDEDADVIVVFGGTNDFGHGDAPLGQMGDFSPYTFYGACNKLMRKLMRRYPHAEIVFMTPLHRVDEERGGHCLRDYVTAIRQVAEYYAIPVVDLYATSGIQPQVSKNRELFAPDGLHPNEAGHYKIYRRLRSALEVL